MYWLKDARETLDVLLTYGDAENPLFVHLLSEYRAVAQAHGRSAEFERLLEEIVALKRPPSAQIPARGC